MLSPVVEQTARVQQETLPGLTLMSPILKMNLMKHSLSVIACAWLIVVPVAATAGGYASASPEFDPDQPFQEALGADPWGWLFNEALGSVQDYVELEGGYSSQDGLEGRHGHFELRIFPRGKSASDEHLSAEGWFSFSPRIEEFRFRFRATPRMRPPGSPNEEDII